MATAAKKITLSLSRDIPFNKLLLSQSNVRKIKAGVSIEELAEDIARRGLLQGLSVRPVTDEAGTETGMFEIPAGGRRYRALELLVKQKRLARVAPVPCVVREDGIAEEDSLAENIQRAPLHPLDQFRAFLALREKGQSEEEIAAAFFVSVNVVKQRLKLASVSPRLLYVYAENGLTLDQLMAFTVSSDHERQEQVFERLSQSYDKQPYAIRRMLTEGAVRACDKRAQFIRIDAYVDAGGCVMRDLFQGDDGGWLQDVALVDMMVTERLNEEANAIAAEGWKWIEVAPEFPYGHTYGLRQLRGEPVALTDEEEKARDAFQAELDRLTEEYSEADELPDDIDERLGEIETALESFEARPMRFEPNDVARAGAFVSIAPSGTLRVERGYVRPEDEQPIEPESDDAGAADATAAMASRADDDFVTTETAQAPVEPEEDEGLTPISDRLLAELTAHRTLGLRQALGERPETAFLAALHALTLKVFYHYGSDSCLELDLKSVSFGAQAPGLNDSACVEAISKRHEQWAAALPKESEDLWDALGAWDDTQQAALFAHVVSLSVNAVFAMGRSIPGTLAEGYLGRRGITGLEGTSALRFHPRCYYRPDENGPTAVWPAMLAAVTDLGGKLTGLHRTWLDPAGFGEATLGKAPIETPRRAMSEQDDLEPEHAASPTDHVLTELQLYSYRPFADEPDPRPLPEGNMLAGAVADIFDAFIATLTDTRLEPDLGDLLWSTVNLFHRAAERMGRELDDNEQAQRQSQREQDGSEVRSVELERLVAEGRTLVERQDAFELMRDQAGDHYERHAGKPWLPHSGSRVNHRNLTSAMIDSRDFLAARKRAEQQVLLPPGPKIAFTGGLDFNDHKLIWAKLDQVHARHPDMVLMHGKSPKGAEKIASRWADHRGLPQIDFAPDWPRYGRAAPFKRNDQMLDVLPIGVIVFPGTGIQDNLADKAKKLGIPVWRFT